MAIGIREVVEEAEGLNAFQAKIKVVGVGGGGGNMVAHLINTNVDKSVDLAVANTDAQAMKNSLVKRIQLGAELTGGLGAGMVPQVGKDAALESYEDIKEYLSGANLVFISAGLGGGTGTGAAPIIAKAAKEVGALAVSVVTKPFSHEGKKRTRLAEEGLKELRAESDSVLVISNDRLLQVVSKSIGIKESFKIVDDVLARAVNGVSEVILKHSENSINIDFADVRTVLKNKGLALMGIGEASGENAACEAVRNAIASPLFENASISGAMGVIVNFTHNGNCPLADISQACEIIENEADDDVDLISGDYRDESLDDGFVRVMIIATGFEREAQSKNDEVGVLKLQTPKDLTRKVMQPLQKVSSGEYSDSDLELPAYLRHGMD